MSNEEIDAAACQAAGLESKVTWSCQCDRSNIKYLNSEQLDAECTAKVREEEYPRVSTTGDAMLLLMDALPDHVEAQIFRRQKNHYVCKIYDLESDKDGWDAKAVTDSAPMALALAVCELARAKEQGS